MSLVSLFGNHSGGTNTQNKPGRAASALSWLAEKTTAAASAVYHSLPGTGPAKPRGLPKPVIKQIKLAQKEGSQQENAQKSQREAAKSAQLKGRAIEQARESSKKRKKRLKQEKLQASKSQTAAKPAVVSEPPSSESGSSLAPYLKTAAKIAGGFALAGVGAYLAAPYLIGAGGLIAATTAPASASLGIAATAPLNSSLAAAAGCSGFYASIAEGAGSLLAAGAAMSSAGNFTIDGNSLNLFAKEIGIPKSDLLSAVEGLQQVQIDPSVRSTLLESDANSDPLPQIQESTTLAVQSPSTSSSTMQSSFKRFCEWAVSPNRKELGNPLQILQQIASQIIKVPVLQETLHSTAPGALTNTPSATSSLPSAGERSLVPAHNPFQSPLNQPEQSPESASSASGMLLSGPGANLAAGAGLGGILLTKLLSSETQPSSRVQEAKVRGANGWSYTIAIHLPEGQKEYTSDEMEILSKALVTGVLDQLSASDSIEAGVPLEIELPETGGFTAKALKPVTKKSAKSAKQSEKPKVYQFDSTAVGEEQMKSLQALRTILLIPANSSQYERERQASFLQLQTIFCPTKPQTSPPIPLANPLTPPIRALVWPVGLCNASIGVRKDSFTASNLCALNAAFQSLMAIEGYRNAMKNSKGANLAPLREAITRYEEIQQDKAQGFVDLTPLLSIFSSHLQDREQHDASEYENQLIDLLEKDPGNPILQMRVKGFKRFTYLSGDKQNTTKDTVEAMKKRFETEKPLLPIFELQMPPSGTLRLNAMADQSFFGHEIAEEANNHKTGFHLRGEMMFDHPPEVLTFGVNRGKDNGSTDLYGRLDARPIEVDETYRLKIKSPDKPDQYADYHLSAFRVYTGSGRSGHHFGYQKQETILADGTTRVAYIETNDAAVTEVGKDKFLAAARQGVEFWYSLQKPPAS
jgi:hypothetical protein